VEQDNFEQIQDMNLHGVILVIDILFESFEYRIYDDVCYLVRNSWVAFYRFQNKLHEFTS
jgi:hypothetical protein